MAESNKPKAVKSEVHGGDSKKTTKGPHGGGNKYFQAKVGTGFMAHDAAPGGVGGKKSSDKKK